MSRNMGRTTNTDTNTRFDAGYRESAGLPVRTRCAWCGEKKHSSKPHPKCSRKLQRARRRGVEV
jgi:hypothetical protein